MMRSLSLPLGSFLAAGALLMLALGVVLAAAALPWTFLTGAGAGGGAGLPSLVARWLPVLRPAASQWGVPPALVEAVMQEESGGNPMALRRDSNGTVDAGLMQINSGNWAAYGLTADPFDPARNIAAGVQMLAGDLRRYGNVALALAAYNAGPGAVARWHGVPPYAAGYVQSVLALYARFVALSGSPTVGGGKGGKTEKMTKH